MAATQGIQNPTVAYVDQAAIDAALTAQEAAAAVAATASTLEGRIASLEALVPAPVVASAPAASASLVGRIVLVRTTGSSVMKVCAQNSGGTYEWVTIATST